jgi:hypothetical protein
MKRRWTAFLAALAGTLFVATGFGYAADRLVSGSAAPRLTSVPASTLAGYGISLAPAAAPPYCGPLQAWGQAPLLQPAGCPMSRQSAEAAAVQAAGSQVVEALLARVTTTARAGGLSGHLAWVVVVRGSPTILPAIRCSVPVGSPGPPPPCARALPIASITQVVILDASSGQVLTVVPEAPLHSLPVRVPPMAVAPPRAGSAPAYTIPPVVKD